MKLIVFHGILFLCISYVFTSAFPNVFSTASNGTGIGYCQEEYSQPGGSNWPMCYKVYKKDVFRNEAKYSCESDGGHLASVPNAFVNSYLYSLAVNADVNDFLLGIQCVGTNCVNDDGTAFGYSNFAPGQNPPLTNCVYMQATGQAKQTWLQTSCDYGFFFACEIPAGVVRTVTCPAGYTNFNERCYKFVEHHSKISANAASDECVKVPGGTLATSGGKAVNEFLAKMDPKLPLYKDRTAFGLRCPNIRGNGDTSSCAWDDGSDFSYNGFTKGNPGMYNTGSGCCDFNGGHWQVCTPCETADYFNAYICEASETTVTL